MEESKDVQAGIPSPSHAQPKLIRTNHLYCSPERLWPLTSPSRLNLCLQSPLRLCLRIQHLFSGVLYCVHILSLVSFASRFAFIFSFTLSDSSLTYFYLTAPFIGFFLNLSLPSVELCRYLFIRLLFFSLLIPLSPSTIF